MIQNLLSEIAIPEDISKITSDIDIPELGNIVLKESSNKEQDIFSAKSRKSWDKSMEARCDFQYHLV